MMLRASGGTGEPGPGGVPAFRGGAGGYGGFGEGFGFGGGGGEGPSNGGGGGGGGGVDIGFMNALEDAAVAEAVAESNEMMSPLGGADAIARSNLVDAFMDTKDGRDLAMFNDSFADIPSQVTSAVPVSNIATDDVGVNTLDEAFLNQYNDPNLSASLPGTNINIPDVSSLLGGVVRPDMMPPGYQPTPDEPTFDDLTFDADQISMNPLDNISSTLGSPIDPVVGLGTTVDPDLNYSLPVAATPADPNFFDIVGNQGISPTLGAPIAPDYGDLNIDMGTDNLGGVAGIQDPSGVQDPSFVAGMNQADANIAAPTLSDSYLGQLGIPDFTPTSPQLDESARDEVVAARAADNASPQLPSIADLDAGMGAAIANNDGFNVTVGNPMASASANVPDLGFDQGMGAAINQGNANQIGLDEAARGQALANRNAVATSEVDPLDNLDLSMDNLGGVLGTVDPKSLPKKGETQKLNLPFEKVMDLVDERIAIQKEIDNAPFNPLSLLPFGSLLGTSAGRRQAAITQALNQSGGSGILGSGIGGSTGILGTGAVQFNPVYDGDGNFVGTQGVSGSGETVSYSGNMQGNNGYFDGDGNNISENIEGYQEEIGGQGSPGGIDVDYSPCQPGYELDPESGTCVPIDVVGGGDSSGPPTLGPIIRPVTPPITSPGVPTPTPVTSPTLTRPKQFNMGGATSGSNLDGAIGRLLSSMS